MARTIRTKVYKFNELSEKAKVKAIEEWRHDGINMDYIYDEAHETVKAFHYIFGTKKGNRSWLEVKTDHLNDDVLKLTGIRLQKYIWNNYRNNLYKGKYYSTSGYYDENKKYHYKYRYSNSQSENCCVLTGVCWDNSLLQPIYDFLEKYKQKADYYSHMDFETLINDCFSNLGKDIEAEVDYRYSDEAISEDIEANEYEFTADGRRFYF